METAIIGSGTMGSGIAQISATQGNKTYLYDIKQELLDQSKAKLEKILLRLIEKGRMDESQKASIQSNIIYTTSFDEMHSCELVIEAIVENADIKKSVFKQLQSILPAYCILASNTSSLSITSLAACLKDPSRFIGIHFFNPAPLMKLVEIIPAIQTSKDVTAKITELIQAWGKITVQAKDTPGFIVNKVARPFYAEALRIFEEGITGLPPEEAFATIDWAMTSHGGFRMGPFTLMDFIGNDVNYTVTETVFKSFYYDPRYKPAFTQKRLSEAGYLGRKSGRGYYTYVDGQHSAKAKEDDVLGKLISDRIIIMLINEAADTLHTGIASALDIDTAMTKGVNYPKGLLAWADEIGIEACVKKMDDLYAEYHEDRYRCSPILRKMARNNQTFNSLL